MADKQRYDLSIPQYDVFLSFAGSDRSLARRLMEEFRRQGMSVFVDDMIDEFEGINQGIAGALASSKTFVAIYSHEFATRPACQRELTAAFIAGQLDGSPTERILVINPEATTDHVHPIELADAKHAAPPDDRTGFAALATKVRIRVRAVTGAFGNSILQELPPWFGALPGHHRFIGRHKDLWALHSALHRSNFRLAHTTSCGSVVSLCGLPGSGKSALVSAYAWGFGSAYSGGIFWHNMKGNGPAQFDDYQESVRTSAIAAGLDLTGSTVGHGDLIAEMGEKLRRRGKPVLWVIDDIPDDFSFDQLISIIPPVGHLLRTVLISQENNFESFIPVLELRGLSTHDAMDLLGSYRLITEIREIRAANRLIERLGGHCGTLCSAGEKLIDADGLISIEDYEAAVQDGRICTTEAVDPVIRRLTSDEKSVLSLAAASGVNILPAELVAAVLGDAWKTVSALAGARRKMVAMRTRNQWWFHPLVTRALARTSSSQHLFSKLVTELLRLTSANETTPALMDTLLWVAAQLPTTNGYLHPTEEHNLRQLVTECNKFPEALTRASDRSH